MNTKDLKVTAMFYVKEHNNLETDEKISIMEFIKDSSKEQVEFLLVTGEVKNELTEDDQKVIEESKDVLYEKVKQFKLQVKE